MSESLKIKLARKVINTEVSLPFSKSISNRLLIMRYLSGDTIEIDNLSSADDTRLMESLLRKIRVHISSSVTSEPCEIDCSNAGTVLRFLTALLAFIPGKWFITGSQRMQQRPLEPLVRALSTLGIQITYTGEYGYPPILVTGTQVKGGRIGVETSFSSQYLSALLMIGPALTEGLTIETHGVDVSRPYAEMTVGLLRRAGINIKSINGTYTVYPGAFNPVKFSVEPDWSSASYWYEIAALVPGSKILLKGLSMKSVQGDCVVAEIFKEFGVNSFESDAGILIESKPEVTGLFEFDFSNYPDLVPAVAAACTALGIKARLTGLAHLRIKESDRIQALVQELKNINNTISVRNNNEISINKGEESIPLHPVTFNTYDDHRMAMALAPLAALFKNATIRDPAVVNKSYPDFWIDIQNAGFFLTSL